MNTNYLFLIGICVSLFGLLYFSMGRKGKGGVPTVRSLIDVRTEFMGIGVVTIAAGKNVDLRISPCVHARLTRLIIPSTVASKVVVDQITVNEKSCLINCGPVPGEMFLHDAVDTLTIDTMQPGCVFRVEVTNISKEDITFSMGAVARVIDDSKAWLALDSPEKKALDAKKLQTAEKAT